MSSDRPPANAALEALDRIRRMGSVQARYTRSALHTLRPRSEAVYTGSGSDSRDPRRIGEDLAEVIRTRGWKTSVEVGAILQRWPQLVGANVAEHCVPTVCEPPKLTVQASSTTWATQMRIMSHTVLQRLEEGLGSRVIEEIEILAPAQRSWKRGRRSVKGRGPRDTYG